jgi:hypothetical protein
MYSFCLHGVSFWVVIADHYQENDDALPLVSLKSNGKIAIADITLWEEMRQSKLGNRVLDQDVIGFFKAHQQSAVD